MANSTFELRDRVRVLERENASLIRDLQWKDAEFLRMKKLYEPDVTPDPIEASQAKAIETETAQRQRSAAALSSGEGDDAEYLEGARRAAWQAVEGDAKFIAAQIEGNENPYPSGWPDALPKHVVCNRYVQLDDTGTSLADWSDVAGGHQIGHPGKPIGAPVPLQPDKPKGPSTWLGFILAKIGSRNQNGPLKRLMHW